MEITVGLKKGEIDVDESMAAIVIWLDRFRSVYIVHSFPGKQDKAKPTVIFTSDNDTDLVKIIKISRGDAALLIDEEQGEIQFRLRFHSNNCVRTFKSRLDTRSQ